LLIDIILYHYFVSNVSQPLDEYKDWEWGNRGGRVEILAVEDSSWLYSKSIYEIYEIFTREIKINKW
jgi:hypothetical protein